MLRRRGRASRASAPAARRCTTSTGPDAADHVPTDLGGGLLTNQLLTEGHRAEVDWGKYHYADNEPGQIVGITYFATTRNEFDARFQAHENYEPGIPDVTVRLEARARTASRTPPTTSSSTSTSPTTGTSPSRVRRRPGVRRSRLQRRRHQRRAQPAHRARLPRGADHRRADQGRRVRRRLRVRRLLPGGARRLRPLRRTTATPCARRRPTLVAGTYVTHAIMPKDATTPALQSDRRKDISEPRRHAAASTASCARRTSTSTSARSSTPAIPPPPCAGDLHTVHIDPDVMPRGSPYDGQDMPLCDKRLVVLQNKQNANADFFMQTNFANGDGRRRYVPSPAASSGWSPTTSTSTATRSRSGTASRARWPTSRSASRDYNSARSTRRVDTSAVTAELRGAAALDRDVQLPDPAGALPRHVLVVVNDPGDKAHPNPNYNPDYLTASSAWDVWPGQTDQLDTPLDPISGTGCEDPAYRHARAAAGRQGRTRRCRRDR